MGKILIEVAYAKADEQRIIPFEVDSGTTVKEAIILSGILDRYKEIDLENSKVGVFGHAESFDKVLEAMDRVEIYRPITCDPKEVRRQRAKNKKKK